MNHKVLALCDNEIIYLHHMLEYMQSGQELPFSVHGFTSVDELIKFSNKSEIELLLIAENIYEESLEELPIAQMVILNESGSRVGKDRKNINKYQSLQNIMKEITESYVENAGEVPIRFSSTRNLKIIGNYTPIRRCLQTTFSLCMGQILAKEHKVLYLNFENYSGLSYLLDRDFKMDITDVLYFLNCDRERLSYRLSGIVNSINGLDFIPPVISYKELNMITGQQWINLLHEIEEATDYEYLILDLSEQVQGLFEILRQCFKVFTIIREDCFAAAKVKQYEAMLQIEDCRDIVIKTRKWNLPLFRSLPHNLEQLTHGELASYVREIIEEDIYAGTE